LDNWSDLEAAALGKEADGLAADASARARDPHDFLVKALVSQLQFL
jgi:hypothetical protein